MNKKSIRVLLTKVGLDGHETGIRVVAMALRSAGMEVIYTGLYQTPQAVVNTAIQEDVDVIGISSLSGGHMTYVPKIIQLIKSEGRENDFLLLLGGVTPRDEAEELKQMGVSEVFRAGTHFDTIIKHIQENVPKIRSHY